jgi:general secretion pathway protein H
MLILVTGKPIRKSSNDLNWAKSVFDLTLKPSLAGRGKYCSGFTLLELLVVVLIIGLGVAIVSVSIGDNKPQELRNNARDFANYTALVEEEAVLSREPWGVQIYRASEGDEGGEKIAYRFLHLTDNGWIPDHPLDIPAGGEFAENVIVELEVEGAQQLIEPLPKELSDNQTAREKASNKKPGDNGEKKVSANTPTIWLASGGDVTPFELRLRFKGDDRGPIVRSDALGRIQLEIKDDEER